VVEALRQVNFGYFAIGLVFVNGGAAVMGYRLKLILAAHEKRLSWIDGWNATYVGLFFNNFLPTSVGGDLVKAFCLSRRTEDPVKAFSGVFMDRVLGLSVFVMIPSVTVLFIIDEIEKAVPVIIFSIMAATLIALFALFHSHGLRRLTFIRRFVEKHAFGRKLIETYRSLMMLAAKRQLILQICAYVLLSQTLNILSIYWIVRSLGAAIDVRYVFIFVPIIHLFSMLPSMNGLGVREYGFFHFFRGTLGEGVASATAVLYLFFLITMSLIGGIIYMFRQDYHFNKQTLKTMFGKEAGQPKVAKERLCAKFSSFTGPI